MSASLANWSDLEMFLAAARHGTLAGAAEALKINASTVQRRIGKLETELETKLFDRSPRGYALTPAGEELFTHVLQMELQAIAIARRVAGRDQSLEGPIRIATVDDLAIGILSPLLRTFGQRNPRVTITVDLGSHFADLARRQADVALRFGEKPSTGDVIARHLIRADVAVYGSRGYFRTHGRPKGPEELHRHAIVCGDESMSRLPMERHIRAHTEPENIAYCSNSMLARLVAVRDGIGVGYLPCFMAHRERSLERLDLGLPPVGADIWMLVHADLRRNARVRALVDFLSTEFDKLRPRFTLQR